jgi:hypothetical protein
MPPTPTPLSPEERLARRASWLFALSVGLTVVLYVIPYGRIIGYPLILVSTVVHELGHGIAGWLVGGRFVAFRMYADGSGVAEVVGFDGRFARAFVSAGGLCGPAVMAAVGLLLARGPRAARVGLWTLGVSLALIDVLLVRSFFGLAFILALAAIAIAIAWRGADWLAQLTLLFVSVQLALSVFSRGDYLFTDVARTGNGDFPSDVANMASALFLPYWFWGALCGLFSVAMLALGGWLFLRSLRAPDASATPRPPRAPRAPKTASAIERLTKRA